MLILGKNWASIEIAFVEVDFNSDRNTILIAFVNLQVDLVDNGSWKQENPYYIVHVLEQPSKLRLLLSSHYYYIALNPSLQTLEHTPFNRE